MFVSVRSRCIWVTSLAFSLLPLHSRSQAAPAGVQAGPMLAATSLPEAPTPQTAPASSSSQSDPAQPASSSTSTVQQTPDAKTQRDQAEQQLKLEEHQRVGGVMAAFNTTQNHDALPLSSSQKFQLFFKSETDPWPFVLTAFVAGIGQADDSFPAWGQGMQGYGKRYGAAYTDAFIGNFFGNAVLTSWWHEDPRFYQKTEGSALSKTLWAATGTVWAKRDNGTWGPNYANVAGNFIGAAIARIYYPPSERNVSSVIYDGITVSAEGIVGSEVIEWWPAIVRHHRRKLAEKQARQLQTQPSIDR